MIHNRKRGERIIDSAPMLSIFIDTVGSAWYFRNNRNGAGCTCVELLVSRYFDLNLSLT